MKKRLVQLWEKIYRHSGKLLIITVLFIILAVTVVSEVVSELAAIVTGAIMLALVGALTGVWLVSEISVPAYTRHKEASAQE